MPPEEHERPGGGAMPLAQLKEPWPLMELVPLDPEVSEQGGEPAPAADDLWSPQGRGGSRRPCNVSGACEGASALRSLAPSSAPPPSASAVCTRGTVPPSTGNPLSPQRGSRGALSSGLLHPTHLGPMPGAVGASSISADRQGRAGVPDVWDSTRDKDYGIPPSP